MGYKYSEADHEWHTIQYNTIQRRTYNLHIKTHAHTFLLGKKIPIHRPELTCYYVYILFVLVVIIHIYISVSNDIWTNLNKGIGYSSKRDDQKTKKSHVHMNCHVLVFRYDRVKRFTWNSHFVWNHLRSCLGVYYIKQRIDAYSRKFVVALSPLLNGTRLECNACNSRTICRRWPLPYMGISWDTTQWASR